LYVQYRALTEVQHCWLMEPVTIETPLPMLSVEKTGSV
jgi:hypothetical protein